MANPESEIEVQKKRRESRPKGYWKAYRANHPTATARNRVETKLRRRLKKQSLQRQLDILQPIDQLRHCAQNCKFATSRRYLIEELSSSQLPETKTIEEG